ncbi:MAG TPA: DUF559 domain-containing protein [Pseudolysinimonas sp.]|nr:DUF559 domain-containing protein [Pseudolysinimonas sp.]
MPESIALAIRCQGAETGFVLLESALHHRRLSRGERALLNVAAPNSFRSLALHAGALSESGTESLMKLLLLDLALPFRQQVEMAGVGRVDFVLGNRLVVEVDSREFHRDPLVDRQRDAALSARGYRSLRFMYAQIVHDRDAVRNAIVGAVIRGDLSA